MIEQFGLFIKELEKRMTNQNKLRKLENKKTELVRKLQLCEHYKEKIVRFVQELNNQHNQELINHEEYYYKLNRALEQRTPEQWIKYYDWSIDYYKYKLNIYDKEIKKQENIAKIVPAVTILTVFMILGFGFLFLKPAITGLIVGIGEEAYTQDINLIVNESSVDEWQLEQIGILRSVRVDGKILGSGSVKIYLDDKLILDSSKLEKSGIGMITGLAIGDLTETNDSAVLSENITENITAPEIEEIENITNITQEVPENITETVVENITHPIEIEEILFKDICIETCSLNLNKTSYELKFEIENAVLYLDSISYTLKPIEIPEMPKPVEEVSKVEETIQGQAEINKPVKWTKSIVLDETVSNLTVKLPKDISDVKVSNIKDKIKEEISSGKLKIKEAKPIKEHVKKKTEEETELIIEEDVKEVEIEYYTKAPEVMEEYISDYKKQITIYSDVHYENILAYTSIRESKKELIKLYWMVNDSRELVSYVNYIDTNSNGLIDRIEWTVPSLSNQTYEVIIEISKAEHLDENHSFISDIYDGVYQLDNVWSEPVYNNEYVRVTFERNLTSDRDITVYARNTQQLNTRIEVYYYNSTEKITEFPIISEEKYYKVYLTGMSGSHDTFDLRIKNLDNNENAYLEFDHIIDPANTTIFEDGFEGDISTNWTVSSTWVRESTGAPNGGVYDGSYDAKFVGNKLSGNLDSIQVDTSGANVQAVYVKFVFYDDDCDAAADMYLDYNNSAGNWVQAYDLGAQTDDTWTNYSDRITSSDYLHASFAIRFRAVNFAATETFWVDKVEIIKEEATAPSTSPIIKANITKPDTVYTNTKWMFNMTATDPDNSTFTSYVQFYVNDTTSGSVVSHSIDNNTNTNVANLSNSEFNKGATLIAEFWAGDSIDNTTKENTTSVTVSNLAPTIHVQNSFVNCSAGHCFNVTAGVSDLDGGSDIAKTNISTTSGSCEHYSNTTTGNYFNVTYNCSGTALTSTNIIVGFNDSSGSYVETTQNSNVYPDQTPTLTTNPAINDTSPRTDSILNCDAGTYDDADNDAQSTSNWKWFKNDIEISGETSQTLNLSVAGNGNKNDLIICSEQPTNNYGTGSYYNSSSVTILNTAPAQPGLTHPDNNAYINSITMNWSASSDADGDTVYYYVLVNGTQVCYTTDLNCSYNPVNSYYQWNVTPYDGTVNGTTSNSMYYTYDTTSPQYSNVGKNDSTINVNDSVLFYAQWSDSLSGLSYYIFRWNNSGTMQNDSAQALTDWSNITKIVNATENSQVDWIIYANDSAGNWNNTETQNFTVAVKDQTTTPISPANGFIVDRDSVNGTAADSVRLVAELNDNKSGIMLTFKANLTIPGIAGEVNIVLGNATTNSTGHANITWGGKDNNSEKMYAGNYTWWAEGEEYPSNETMFIYLYGGLNLSYRYADKYPDENYTQGDIANFEMFLDSSGPETKTQINSTYFAKVNSTLTDPSGTNYSVELLDPGEDEPPIRNYNYQKKIENNIKQVEVSGNEITTQYLAEISKAEHLDENYNFIFDIYDDVYQLDDVWSEPVYHNEYVRVAFKQNLTPSRDITVYARNTQQLNTRIEVYYYNSTEKITEFPIISEEKYYKVYLTGMSGSHDTFDLKIKNLDNNENAHLEFDYIVDPANTTIFNDGFETDITTNWTATGNWIRDNDITSQEGSWHAHLDTKSASSELISKAVDTSGANVQAVYVNFYYQDDDCDTGDMYLYYNNSAGTWVQIFDLTSTDDDVWQHYEERITNSNYFHSGFAIRVYNPIALAATENFWVDILKIIKEEGSIPNYSGAAVNDSEVFEGESVNQSITISDSPDGYIFSWNGTSGCTGGWSNSSWVDVSGSSVTAYNVSTPGTGCSGKTIGWKFYGNNSAGWSSSTIETYSVYSYGVLSVSLSLPSNNTAVPQNNTFTINATINCVGESGAKCGTVKALARYNKTISTPDTGINTTAEATPFYIVGASNPQTSPSTLDQGQSWNVSWTVNATGLTNTQYLVDVLFNSSYGSVADNDTINPRIYIGAYAKYWNGTFNTTGKQTGQWNITTTANADWFFTHIFDDDRNFTLSSGVNTAPEITDISDIPAQSITEAGISYVEFFVLASDADEVDNLDDASLNATFTRAGEETRFNSSCSWVNDINTTTANYTCTIGIWYWDGAGTWDVNATILDLSSAQSAPYSEMFTLQETTAMVMNPTALTWPSIGLTDTNVLSDNDPIVVNNTANKNIADGYVKVTAIDLRGETTTTDFIYAHNFTGNINDACEGTVMANNTAIAVSGATIIAGNNSAGQGQEELYFCMEEVPSGISSQTYSTTGLGSWIISVS